MFNKKIKKIMIIGIFCVMSLVLTSCGKSKATNFMEKVEAIGKDGLPTLSEVKALEQEYNNLTPNQKEQVTNYGDLVKYLDMDLDALNSLQDDIDNVLNSEKVSYADIIDIEKRYEELNSDEQSYISGIKELEKFKELDEYEKAAVVATRFLKQSLKNSDSLEVDEINVKKEGNYYVKVNYSATNGFGARKDDVACMDVTSSFQIGIIGLSSLMGNFDEASNTCLGGYLGFSCEEIEVDADKVLYNLDAQF